MPWKETHLMDLRVSLVTECLRGEVSVASVCREFGVSRKTAYKWIGRFVALGAAGLAERSRAARRHPLAVTKEIEQRALECRRRHPTWGPRKLLVALARLDGQARWPCASTLSAIIKRHGLNAPRKRKRRATPCVSPLGRRARWAKTCSPTMCGRPISRAGFARATARAASR